MSGDRGARILAAAEAYTGVPYGLPPGPGQLDCSLLVLAAYRDAGYPFPPGIRTAEQQRQACQQIPNEQVQPGDLIFFEHTYNAGGQPGPDGKIASHVGISYGAGSGQMIDAQLSASRDGVGKTNIRSAYWQDHWLTTGRYAPAVAPPSQPDPGSGGFVVSGTGGSGLRVRSAPSTEAAVLGTLPEGTRVAGDEYAWRRVRGNGLDGWSADDYLVPVEGPAPPPAGFFTPEQVARVLAAPLANTEPYLPLVEAALDELGILNRATTIAAHATIGVEAPPYAPIEEYRNADGSIPEYWHYYGGGARYHGRGFIQLTHDYNYRHYGDELGVDLLNNPELALDPTISARVLALYFQEHNIPELAQQSDWLGVRVAVNGGTNGWDRFARLVDAFEALP